MHGVLGAKLVSGAELIDKHTGLSVRAASADIVITGEGCFDSQSLDGKLVGHVLNMDAKRRIVVCGRSEIDPPPGVELYSLVQLFGLEAALNDTAGCLERVGRMIK